MTIKKIKWAGIFWLLVWMWPALAQEASGVMRFSLKEAQAYAVKFNAEMKNARIDVAIAKKKIWETTALGLPQLSAKLSYLNNLKIPTTLIPAKFLDPDAAEDEFIGVKFGTQHNATADLTATQLIFNGSYFVALQASKVYLQLSLNQEEKKELDIRETIANTYYLILLAENNYSILQSSLENLRQTLTETTAMVQVGFTEATAVDQLQLTVTDLENTLNTTRRQVEMSYLLLKLQLGIDQETSIQLTEALTAILAGMDPNVPSPADVDLTRHIDFRILDTREESLALLLKREKAEFLPTVSAFFSLSQSAMRERFDFFNRGGTWFPSSILGFNLTVPVFTSGQRLAKVAQARMELEKVRNLKKQAADGLKLALQQARSDFLAAQEREKTTAGNAILAQRILDHARSKFSQGLISTMELTQTHTQYLNAQAGHSQAVVDLLSARIKLDKALDKR